MTITIKNQNFGIEIELTGITRKTAATTIARYYGTESYFVGGTYSTYAARDSKGREWKAARDSSIVTTKKENGVQVSASDLYSCEVVTPILQYEDIEDLQKIVRALVAAGAVANNSCGIHVHVDGANHTPQSLTRLNRTAGPLLRGASNYEPRKFVVPQDVIAAAESDEVQHEHDEA